AKRRWIMSEPIRVAAVQMDPKLGDVARNRDTIIARLIEAARQGARLVAFPECALTGYRYAHREEAPPLADSIPAPSLTQIAETCREVGAYAVLGMIERDGDRLYNAAALVGPDGVIGSYRKVHLPYIGLDRFADPGDRPFAVHEAAGLRVGMHICYDG